MDTAQTERGVRKRLVGTVISNKMQKTVVVAVSRKVQHPKYRKYMASRKNYYVRDEHSECRIGDEVEIVETRPLSKLVRWRLLEIKSRAHDLTA